MALTQCVCRIASGWQPCSEFNIVRCISFARYAFRQITCMKMVRHHLYFNVYSKDDSGFVASPHRAKRSISFVCGHHKSYMLKHRSSISEKYNCSLESVKCDEGRRFVHISPAPKCEAAHDVADTQKKCADDQAQTCGFSHSVFVQSCVEKLEPFVIEKLALRLRAYRNLRSKPKQRNRRSVIANIEKILPREHRAELTGLLSRCLDVLDPQQLLRLKDATLAKTDDTDYLPLGTISDYTFGAQMLQKQKEDDSLYSDALSDEYVEPQTLVPVGKIREIATRPPVPTKMKDKRIGEMEVELEDAFIPREGSISERMVFLSNIPHASRQEIEKALRQAFSSCGEIVNLEIFDDRLRTLDETEENAMQQKGYHAINLKMEGRFSPIFALAEFKTKLQKQRACHPYLRAFGVPCVDRLVYAEDAAFKTTLIATNIPYALKADEVARIFAFAFVYGSNDARFSPSLCRIRMNNPDIFNYRNIYVECRSNQPQPIFLLPLQGGLRSDQSYCAINANTAAVKAESGWPESKDKPSIPSYYDENYSVELKKSSVGAVGCVAWSQESVKSDSLRCLADTVNNDRHREKILQSPNSEMEATLQFNVKFQQNNAAHIATDANYDDWHVREGYRHSRSIGFNIPASSLDEVIYYSQANNALQDDSEDGLGDVFKCIKEGEDLAKHVIKRFLKNRLVLNNDGMFVLRFKSFEAALFALRSCRSTVIFDTKTILLFSPRRCIFRNGKMVDFVVPEGNSRWS